MARAKRPVGNPSIPRLEWVGRTYPEWVWYYTVRGFFLATGMDTDADDLAMSAADVQYSNGYLAAQGHEVPTFPEALSEVVEQEIDFAGLRNTEYDKYLPWLAKSLNGYGKGPSKKVRKLLEAQFPDMILPADQRGGGDAIKIVVGPFRSTQDSAVAEAVDGLDYYDQREARDLLYDWHGDLFTLSLSFGSIVHWVLEAGVNLDDYSGEEAKLEAMRWADNRPKGDVVRGDVVYTFTDGWTFQELKTRRQLECEGTVQDHCVQHYSPGKIGKKYRIFSLRDPDGQPVTTMEWNVLNEFVYQYKGLSNAYPEKECVEKAIEFRLEYIDKNLLSPSNKLERVSHYSEYFPDYVGEFKGDFKGVFMPPEDPAQSFALFGSGAIVSVFDIKALVQEWENIAYGKFGAGGSLEADAEVLEKIRDTNAGAAMGYGGGDQVELGRAWMAWDIWKLSGTVVDDGDEVVEQAGYYDLRPPKGAAANPGKRRKAKRKKTPEYKRILDRSRRLWETYDAKPLKKNLVAFGTHVERMEKSSSLKVKTEARRAARAFNAEFRARGWKKKGKKGA